MHAGGRKVRRLKMLRPSVPSALCVTEQEREKKEGKRQGRPNPGNEGR